MGGNIQHANLRWDSDGQPVSGSFDDVYFSKLSGLDETRYVFLQHNQLEQRFSQLNSGDLFVVGETGFGTGLNFLACWQLFDNTTATGARLHFISTEKYPLSPQDWQMALAMWPELDSYSQQLLSALASTQLQSGSNLLCFADGQVSLQLLVGDSQQQLAQQEQLVDAWFLDGFAPAKNPEMWTQDVFQQLARLSAPQANIATFTSAGFVRRGLEEVGFKMQRCKGFAFKRQMLQGQFQPAE